MAGCVSVTNYEGANTTKTRSSSVRPPPSVARLLFLVNALLRRLSHSLHAATAVSARGRCTVHDQHETEDDGSVARVGVPRALPVCDCVLTLKAMAAPTTFTGAHHTHVLFTAPRVWPIPAPSYRPSPRPFAPSPRERAIARRERERFINPDLEQPSFAISKSEFAEWRKFRAKPPPSATPVPARRAVVIVDPGPGRPPRPPKSTWGPNKPKRRPPPRTPHSARAALEQAFGTGKASPGSTLGIPEEMLAADGTPLNEAVADVGALLRARERRLEALRAAKRDADAVGWSKQRIITPRNGPSGDYVVTYGGEGLATMGKAASGFKALSKSAVFAAKAHRKAQGLPVKTALDDPAEDELNAQEKARVVRAQAKLNSFLRYGDDRASSMLKEPSLQHEEPRSWDAAEALEHLRGEARSSMRALLMQSMVDTATHQRHHNGAHVPWPQGNPGVG